MTVRLLKAAPPFLVAIVRMMEHLPEDGDQTLVILKGHLLIEEQLRELLASKMKEPGRLKEARLEFDQCLILGRALLGDTQPEWIWNAIRKLNSIRNALAHNLEPKGLKEKISDFSRYVKSNEELALPDKLSGNLSPLSYGITSVYLHFVVWSNPKKKRKIQE